MDCNRMILKLVEEMDMYSEKEKDKSDISNDINSETENKKNYQPKYIDFILQSLD